MSELSELVMNPRMNAGGLLLASTATRNPLPDCALASTTATSPWERTPKIYGSMANYLFLPTVAEPLASKKRYQSTENVLPVHGILVRNPSVQLEKNRVSELSLSPRGECLSLHSSILSVVQKSGNAPARWKRFCSLLSFQRAGPAVRLTPAGAFIPPLVETQGHPERNVW